MNRDELEEAVRGLAAIWNVSNEVMVAQLVVRGLRQQQGVPFTGLDPTVKTLMTYAQAGLSDFLDPVWIDRQINRERQTIIDRRNQPE